MDACAGAQARSRRAGEAVARAEAEASPVRERAAHKGVSTKMCAQKWDAKRHFPYIDSHTDIARVCKSNTMCVSEYEYDARWSTES